MLEYSVVKMKKDVDAEVVVTSPNQEFIAAFIYDKLRSKEISKNIDGVFYANDDTMILINAYDVDFDVNVVTPNEIYNIIEDLNNNI